MAILLGHLSTQHVGFWVKFLALVCSRPRNTLALTSECWPLDHPWARQRQSLPMGPTSPSTDACSNAEGGHVSLGSHLMAMVMGAHRAVHPHWLPGLVAFWRDCKLEERRHCVTV
eukprot:6490353-Amphidinium_carterae.3